MVSGGNGEARCGETISTSALSECHSVVLNFQDYSDDNLERLRTVAILTTLAGGDGHDGSGRNEAPSPNCDE